MRNRKLWLLLMATVLTFSLVGCGLFGPEKEAGNSIDPPPDLSMIPILEQGDLVTNEGGTFTVSDIIELSVYFVDGNEMVVPMAIQIPKAEGIAKETLKYMTKGGPALTQIAGTNLVPVLPAGTQVLGMAINEGVARVNFSKEFLNYDTKAEERKMIEAVVWTLTEFPTIDSVQFMVEGQFLEAMPVGGTPLTEPVTRSMGINVEVSGQANISSPALTSQVTLYFQAVDSIGEMYFVPVTRVIPRNSNPLEAVVQETLKGPIHDFLFSATVPTTKINKLDKKGTTLHIDFDDKLTTYGPGSQGELSVMQSLLLGLTEGKDIEQVKITINGQVPVLADSPEAQPTMTRPQLINKVGL
ncbi:hypothetical protein BHU72_12255 [Desulfuribacillus stibiiarsenatis]|uniref:GerMN domain-containing protein n=1 Tax=Desulfuribacillus stibiiarsenatis TaxID=1390249 RepID=A0A1E5L2B7_9FIRM|nr:GerMN domain-containing protein [Desulfuribacillus stibiiarsenatis]OEH84173.1 hypothetical protein BHU72_12255 [Desulfuribacillus stibiiarsenatis]